MSIVVYSADLDLVEMGRAALEDIAPVHWLLTEQQLFTTLLTQPVVALVIDGSAAQTEELCLRLRVVSDAVMVVIATGETAEERVRLLRAGADDVLARPFAGLEVRARVQAKIRRATRAPAHELPPRLVTTLRIFNVLQQHAGSFMSTKAIKNALPDEDLATPRLRTCVSDLQRRLSLVGGVAAIEGRYGHGYRLVWRHAVPAALV